MKKSVKVLLISLILIALIIIFQVFYSYSKIDNFLIYEEILSQNEYVKKAMKEYEVVECKFNLLHPEYALVALEHYVYPEDNVDRIIWHVTFHNFSRSHLFSTNWQTAYTGGTTIKNTTFPELVKMVKEDCFQFQQSKGDFSDEIINWSYSEYIPQPPRQPKAVRTDEEEAEWQEMMLQRTIEIGKKTKRIKAEIISE